MSDLPNPAYGDALKAIARLRAQLAAKQAEVERLQKYAEIGMLAEERANAAEAVIDRLAGLQRYAINQNDAFSGYTSVHPDPNGEWLKASDIDQIIAEYRGK